MCAFAHARRQGRLLCSVVRGRVRAPGGRHLASVVAATTPLVEHILLVAGKRRPRTIARCQYVEWCGQVHRTCVGCHASSLIYPIFFHCCCRRAWLPPSASWLFAPRNHAYDVGGWYFELPEDDAGLPAPDLHPHMVVLLAALRSYERRSQHRHDDGSATQQHLPMRRLWSALQHWSRWWGAKAN